NVEPKVSTIAVVNDANNCQLDRFLSLYAGNPERRCRKTRLTLVNTTHSERGAGIEAGRRCWRSYLGGLRRRWIIDGGVSSDIGIVRERATINKRIIGMCLQCLPNCVIAVEAPGSRREMEPVAL